MGYTKKRNTSRGLVKEQIHINLPIDMIDRLEARAEKEHRSRSNLIYVLLEQALDD